MDVSNPLLTNLVGELFFLVKGHVACLTQSTTIVDVGQCWALKHQDELKQFTPHLHFSTMI